MNKVFLIDNEKTNVDEMIDNIFMEITKDVNGEYYIASKNKRMAAIVALGLHELTGAKVLPLEVQ
ncbi:MAG: hypothetical protein ABIM30_00015 [candidate division WOR-3 bacterium]